MAEIERKRNDNIAGLFFVDDSCIDCDACRTNAPKNFTRNNEEGYSYVHKQPETEEELIMCENALSGCPVDAIGKNNQQGQTIAVNSDIHENVS